MDDNSQSQSYVTTAMVATEIESASPENSNQKGTFKLNAKEVVKGGRFKLFSICAATFAFITVAIGIVGFATSLGSYVGLEDTDREIVAVNVISGTLTASKLPVMVDVGFYNSLEGCPSGWESIFDVNWPGVHESCVQYGVIERKDQLYKGKTEKEILCDDAAGAIPPVSQQLFQEVAICAKMVYYTQSSDLIDCSSPCNPRTADLQHWVQCPIASEDNKCPIVGLKFLSKTEADQILQNSQSEWVMHSYEHPITLRSFYLAHTTTDSDQNPLVNAMVADIDPCLDPTTTDHTRGPMTVYPLEKYEGCTNFNSLRNDERYTMQPIDQNEYEVQLASGVLNSLQQQTIRYNEFVPDPTVKKEIKLNAYTRAAPALECDSDEQLQLMLETSEIYDAEKMSESQDLMGSAITLTLIDIIVFSIGYIISVFIIVKHGGEAGGASLCCLAVFTLAGIGLSIAIMVAAGSAKTSFEEADNLMDNLYGNYRCGDSVSAMIGEFMNSEVAGRSQVGVDGSSYFQIFSILAFLLSLVGAIITSFLCLAARE